MSQSLHFDPETHIYTIDGRRLPSVTQVLSSVFEPKDYWTEWHRERGIAVHKAVEIIAKGGKVDPSTLDERIAGRVAGFELFLREHPTVEIVWSELRMMHATRFFAGTADLGLDDKGKPIVADIKGTIDPVTSYPQLGGYSLLWQSTFPKVRPPAEAWGIELTDDGKYKLKIGKRGNANGRKGRGVQLSGVSTQRRKDAKGGRVSPSADSCHRSLQNQPAGVE